MAENSRNQIQREGPRLTDNTSAGFVTNAPRGSVWRKWDLHIHTPASFHWKDGAVFSEMDALEKQRILQRMVDRMNSSDVIVFGVMDYWTFDGYFELRGFIEANPGILRKGLLPGIELRLEAPTDFRLNTQVIFSESVSNQTLTTFLHNLRCGGTVNKPPTPETLVEIGRSYGDDKLRELGFSRVDRQNDAKMLRAGAMSAVVTRESLKVAMAQVGDERCLLIQPYDTSDGLERLDWKAHPYDDQELMRWAHIFEAKDPVHIDLFLGLGHPTKPDIQKDFLHSLGGYPKPAFRGSDAHRIADYGVFPNNRISWLKADPTFSGLKQVCHEPAARCWVGEQPPKLAQIEKHPTKYIRNVRVIRSKQADDKDQWFNGVSIDLNPGLIAIIGNKGSGKSALADIIALLGNTRTTDFEFLNAHRFRKGKTRASWFKGIITWEDNSTIERPLDSDPDSKSPERVRYLPQKAIEDLCNELVGDGPSSFEVELKKVIFSHVPLEQQMRKENLDQLLAFKTGPSHEAIRHLQQSLSTLNARIIQLESETSDQTIATYRNALALKKAELDAHLAKEPKPPEQGGVKPPTVNEPVMNALTEAKEKVDVLVSKLDNLKSERVELFEKTGKIKDILGRLQNINNQLERFSEEIKSSLQAINMRVDEVLTFKITTSALDELHLAALRRIQTITEAIDGKDDVAGIMADVQHARESVKALQAQLDAPQKAQQQYLANKASWQKRTEEINGAADRPDTKAFFEAKLKAAVEMLPKELAAAREDRRGIVRKIHAQLVDQRAEYERLYAPVQRIAADSPLTKKALNLDFAVFLSHTTFEDQFINLINRQRRGPFQGEEEGAKRLHDLINQCDFSDCDALLQCLDGIIDSMVAKDLSSEDKLSLSSQLRKDVKLADFYDTVYSLGYLQPRYTLRLDGKEISELSPGEKGALLLVFYLLLDQEEIPIIIDQPEQNLDNESVVRLLVDCIRRARERRQVILVTHNPNLAIVCDADQIISSRINKSYGNQISYNSGAIENPSINFRSVDVLEGTFPAFDKRRQKWFKPPMRES